MKVYLKILFVIIIIYIYLFLITEVSYASNEEIFSSDYIVYRDECNCYPFKDSDIFMPNNHIKKKHM